MSSTYIAEYGHGGVLKPEQLCAAVKQTHNDGVHVAVVRPLQRRPVRLGHRHRHHVTGADVQQLAAHSIHHRQAVCCTRQVHIIPTHAR